MSTPTLPKSVQAQAGSATDGSGNWQDRPQQIKDFVEKYRHLPDDFLRVPTSYYSYDQTVATRPRAIVTRETPLVDMIDISVVEAQLVKNYGLLRMDLYCKIRVGHMVCETPTCLNGAKNPKWGGVYQFSLKPGIDSFHLEIYDEKQFSLDEKIAWLYEPIPPEVFQGITVERWFPLSGRLGTYKEGSILLVLSHKRVPMRASNFGRANVLPQHSGAAPLTVFVPAANQGPVFTGDPNAMSAPATLHGADAHHIPTYVQPTPPPLSGNVQNVDVGAESEPSLVISEEDVNQLSEMFPSIDKAIIKAILENNQNNKEAAIGALLALG